MPNSLETKFAVMENRLSDLEKTNSKEHELLFKKLESIDCKMDMQKEAIETKTLGDMEKFVKQRDFNDLAIKVGKHDRFFWMALAVVSFITLLLNLFGKQLISKL